MGGFFADLRHGLRLLFKHPGLAAISILALALGIGLTSMMWSITYGGILRELPYDHGEELVFISRHRPARNGNGDNRMSVPIHDFNAYRAGQHTMQEMGGFYEGTVNVSGVAGRPERFQGAFVTASVLHMLRVRPILGRIFTDDENRLGGPDVIVISWDVWQSKFGGDSSVVGRTLRANGRASEIIGVMPRGFLFPQVDKVWLPLRMNADSLPWSQGNWLGAMGRLKPGVSRQQVDAELGTVAARLEQEHPKENAGIKPLVQTFAQRYVPPEPTLMLWTMMAATFGVLLIACSNVASLLLARAAVRTKEVAIRTALGASRKRVIMQLLTEALAISITGALLGTGIAWLGIRWFKAALLLTDVPSWMSFGIDVPTLMFIIGVTGLAAVVSGIVPALQATGANIYDVLKDESRGASSLRLGRFSRGLVMVELALAGGLLVAAGFMTESVVKRSTFDYGVPTQNIYTARVGLFESTYPDSASHMRFWKNLEDRLAAMPGQHGTGLVTSLPGLNGCCSAFAVDGETYPTDQDHPLTNWVSVSPGFFRAFTIKATEGRLLMDGDIGGAQPVAVVTQGFARRFFKDGSAVGRRIRQGGEGSTNPWLTIVGVVPEVWYDGTDDSPRRRTVLTPIYQGDFRFLSIAVNADGNPMTLHEPVRSAVAAIDADQPTYFSRTLQDAIDSNGWFYSVFGKMFAAFGAAALLLAMVGVYGVMSFAVTRRTQEIGLRMALGAGGRQVLRLFLSQGVVQIAVGLALGMMLAWGLAKGMAGVMFQVNINNLLMYFGVTAALGVTGFVAILIPSLRATRVDPLVALRYE